MTPLRRRDLLTGTAALGAYAALGQSAQSLGIGKLGAAYGSLGSLGGAGKLTGGISFAGGYPLDTVGGVTISGAYGVGALTASWKTGKLFDLVVGGVTTTIKAIGPGYPDLKAIASAIGISPTSGIGGGTISKWYDQSGNGKDWVQATVGNQPELWLINGKVQIAFSGGMLATLVQAMTNALNTDNRSLSLFAALTPFMTQPPGTINSLSGIFGTGVLNAAGATDMGFFGASTDGTGGVKTTTVFAGLADFTNPIEQIISPYIGIQPQILTATASAGGTTFSQNNASGTGSALVAGTHTAAILGTLAVQFQVAARMQALIVSSSVFSGGQVSTIKTALAAWAGVNLGVNRANRLNVVVDGASSDLGQGSDPVSGGYNVSGYGGYGYLAQLQDALPGVSWHNFAQSSATITSRKAEYDSGLVQNSGFQSGSTSNILLAPGISSYAEILATGSAATAFTNFQAWLTAAKSVAWTRVAVIAYPDALDSRMPAYNTLLFANAGSLGYDIIDGRTALVPLITNNNPPYTQPDGHPMVVGSGIYKSLLNPYFQPFM